MRILPRVKNISGSGREVKLGDSLCVYYSDALAKSLEFALSEMMPDAQVARSSSEEDANLLLIHDDSIEMPEGYRISVSDGRIYCRFSDFLGGRNAIATLAQLLKSENGCLCIKKYCIEDAPDAKFRSFMHDVGRKYVPIDELRAHILLMAKCKMNTLHFHFSEAVGFGIKFEEFPELNGAHGKQYTEQEIRELVEYAEKLGIDIIPEIDVPGHSNVFTATYPKTACSLESGEATNGWAMCVSAEETYTLLESLISATVKLFKSEYFHLGTDEISMTDEKRIPHPVADWLSCSRCKALMKKEGYKTEVELFYHFLKRVYKIVKGQGKKLIIWNDWVDISKSPNIPRDIIIEFWRVAAPTRGPHIGCSMQRFLDEGFDVINANFPDTYIDLYVNYERLSEWDYKKIPADDENTTGKIIGGDVCAWDIHSHFSHSVPISIILFADKLWNRTSAWDGDFLRAVSKILIGDDTISIFDFTREVICLDDSGDIFKPDIDRTALAANLKKITPRSPTEKQVISAYLSLLTK